MNVDDKLWRETDMKRVLDRASREIGHQIADLSDKQLQNVRPYLSQILWRWWHLEQNKMMTPAHHGEMVSESESWPMNGQFYPTIRLRKREVIVNLDYLAIYEHPVLVDVARTLDNKRCEYQLGKRYGQVVRELSKSLRWNDENELITAVSNLRAFWKRQVSELYEMDIFASRAIGRQEWGEFWLRQLKQMTMVEGLSTDTLLDEYTGWMRETYPDYGLTTDEMSKLTADHKPSKHELMQYRTQYAFWVNVAHSLLYPLSMYAGVLSPMYTERYMWEEDIEALAGVDKGEPMVMFSPCTNIAATELGKLVSISYYGNK